MLGLPATVTVPGLVSWRKMRWLPRCRSILQPSASRTLIASRIFMHMSDIYRGAKWIVPGR